MANKVVVTMERSAFERAPRAAGGKGLHRRELLPTPVTMLSTILAAEHRSRFRRAVVLSLALCAFGCSRSSKDLPPGRVVVALTIDWEGAYLSPEGISAMEDVRTSVGPVPITHFVSAGYFTKTSPDPAVTSALARAVRKGDEVGLHLHGWRSLATASGITPKLSPSFLTGDDKLLEFEDGDVGFDLDLDAYTVTELRALLRTSRRLLEEHGVTVSRSFRAGGYLGTAKVLEAAGEEGYKVDSSATDYRQLNERKDELPYRLQKLWPDVTTVSQPFMINNAFHELEMPIAAFADYAESAEIVAIFDAAETRLARDPQHDVFVVLGFHQETGDDFASRMKAALTTVRSRATLNKLIVFKTVEEAASLALAGALAARR